MMINVAIADDHEMVISGLLKMMTDFPHINVVDTYMDGNQLLDGIGTRLPDVLILDIQMPGKPGDELVPLLLSKYPELRILTLTGFENTFYARKMLQHGALGYLLKRADQQTLIKAIETVYNYEPFLEPTMKQQIEEANHRLKNISIQQPILTPREKEVLQLIVNGFTSQEISRHLHLGQRTVENYRFSLLLKLDAKNTALLVKQAIQKGLVE